jgi:hypothetical protein
VDEAFNSRFADRRVLMCRNPNAEDSDIDRCDDDRSPNLQLFRKLPIVRDDCYSVDDDLHQKLNFEDP